MEVKEILDLGYPQCGFLALLIGQGLGQGLLQITEDSDFLFCSLRFHLELLPPLHLSSWAQSLGESPRFDAYHVVNIAA